LKVLLNLKDHGNLKNVVAFDKIDQQIVKAANKIGLSVLNFQTLIEEGNKYESINYKSFKIEPNDIYTFSYTSGTTGPPKGAMISH
jgi:long-chain acyl-CoA synthetase